MFSIKHAFFATALLGLFLLSACTTQGEFGPILPSLVAMGTVSSQPQPIDFQTLAENPQAYTHNLFRVSGVYRPVSNNVNQCFPFKGAGVTWALEAEGFRMNMSGFDRMVGLAPDGAQITVDGVWMRYEGPVGCGKEPPTKVVWHLKVNRVVAPNPLVFSGISIESLPNAPTETPLPIESNNEGVITVSTPIPPEPTATVSGYSGGFEVDLDATADAAFWLTATSVAGENVSEGQTPTPSLTPTPDGTTTEESGGEAGEETAEPTVTGIPTRSEGGTTDTPTPSVTPTLSVDETTATAESSDGGIGSEETGSVTQTIIAPTITPTPQPYEGYKEP